jgi:hypothetical protein
MRHRKSSGGKAISALLIVSFVLLVGGTGTFLYLMGPEKAGRVLFKYVGPVILKKITSIVGETSPNTTGPNCSAVNSPNATINCGTKDAHANETPKTETRVADGDDQFKAPSPKTVDPPVSERWPQAPIPKSYSEPSWLPGPEAPFNFPSAPHWSKPPPWIYAYAIDYFVQGEGDGDEPVISTVWISCSEKPWSPRVAELCGSTPQYRKTHHLVRKW